MLLASTGALAQVAPGLGAPGAAALDAVVPGYSAGAVVAQQFTESTGTAISPLFGMCFIGAWRWAHADEAARAGLPWYEQPWFWGTGLALVLVMFLGHRVPVVRTGAKAVRVWESKLAAALAVVVSLMRLASDLGVPRRVAGLWPPGLGPISEAHAAAAGAAVPEASAWLLPGALLCAASGVFVWLLFHVVNVLSLINPFPPLDWALKSARSAVLLLVALSGLVSPWVGAAASAVLLLVALLCAGWAWRWTAMGSVFTWDLLTFAWRTAPPAGEAPLAFVEGGLGTLPPRTLGRLSREGSELRFTWRKWLVQPRTETLPAAPVQVGHGVLSPVLVTEAGGRTLVRFPPRYRGHGDFLAAAAGATGQRPVGLNAGFKAALAWVKGQLAPDEAA